MSYKRGATFERQLIEELRRRGWFAARLPRSGSSSKLLPDIITIRGQRVLMIECKTSKRNRVYVTKDAEKLKKLKELVGCETYLAVKFSRRRVRFYDPSELQTKVESRDSYYSLETVLGKQLTLTSKPNE